MADRDLGSLVLTLQANLTDLNKSLITVQSQVKGMSDNVSTDLKKVSNSWGETMKGFLAAEAVMQGLRALKSIAIDSVKEFDNAAMAVKRLEIAFGSEAKSLVALANARALETRYSNIEYIAAENTLQIHKLNGEQIQKLIPVIEDYAAKSGRGLTETAQAFGYAIQYGATRGLRNFGLEIDKTGSQQEIFNELLKAGEGNVKGLAGEMGDLAAGPVVILKNQLSKIQKLFGETLTPYVAAFAATLQNTLVPALKFTVGLFDKFLKGWSFIGVAAAAFVHTGGNAEKMTAFMKEYYAGQKLYDEALKKQQDEMLAKATAEGKKNRLGTTPLGKEAKENKTDFVSENIKASMAEFKTYIEFIKSENKLAFDSMTIDLDTYYLRETEAMSIEYNNEIENLNLLKDRAVARKDEKAVIDITTQLQSLQLELETKLNVKAGEYLDKKKAIVDAQTRVNEEVEKALLVSGGDIVEFEGSKQKDEVSKLKTQQEKELSQYKKHLGDLINLKATNAEQQLVIDGQIAAQRQLIEEATFKFEEDIAEKETEVRLNAAQYMASGIASILWDIYEMTDKQSRDIFNLWKAAAMAEAVVNTASAAVTAYKAGWAAGGPYAGAALSIVFAAIAAAAGAIQIAKIASTEMGAGGLLEGASHAEGGIPIVAEGGEYMQPKKSVAYYGTGVMEAIRKRAVPREAFTGFGLMSSFSPSGRSFASGGLVTDANAGSGVRDIVNFVDPRLMEQYLATADGQRAIVNVIGTRAFDVRRILG